MNTKAFQDQMIQGNILYESYFNCGLVKQTCLLELLTLNMVLLSYLDLQNKCMFCYKFVKKIAWVIIDFEISSCH